MNKFFGPYQLVLVYYFYHHISICVFNILDGHSYQQQMLNSMQGLLNDLATYCFRNILTYLVFVEK